MSSMDRRRMCNVLTVAVLMGVCAIEANAQFAPSGDQFARELRPDFLLRDMQLINDRLSLGDEQQDIIRSVLQDYVAAFDESARIARAELAASAPMYERIGAEIQARQEQLRQEMEVLVGQLQASINADTPPDQLEALRAQLTARIEAVKIETEELIAQANQMQQPALEQLAAELRDALNRWRVHKRELAGAFTTDVRLILGDEQAEQWDRVLNEIRRQRLLPAGELSGESIDLFNVVRQAGLEPVLNDPARAELDNYATSLDAVLAAREQALDDAAVRLWVAVRSGRHQDAANERARIVAARVVVRDTHLSAAQRLAEHVSDEQAAELDRTVRRLAFSDLTDSSIGSRLLNQASAIEGLEPELRQAIVQRAAEHDQQWRQLIQNLQQVTLEKQPVALIARPAHADGRSESAAAQQAMADARRSLDQLNLETIEIVFGTLGDQRFHALNSAPEATALSQAMTERQTERRLSPSERRELMRRFDLDGDGVLSDEERRAMGGGG